MIIRFTIFGVPAPKGNSRQVWRNGKRMRFAPDARFLAWQKNATLQINLLGIREPVTHPVRVKAVFYRDARADIDNLQKGLGDLLQHAGVLKNDRLIRAWSTERRPHLGNPRVEVEITEWEE